MDRKVEPEVADARERMFEAAREADAAMRRWSWERVLLGAFLLGFATARFPAVRSLFKEGIRWWVRGRS